MLLEAEVLGGDGRFVFIRTREPKQRKGPLQLNLFAPYEYGYQFKVIHTNATLSARKLLALHNGRGAQEVIFAELKSQTQMDYIPCRRLAANQTWLLAAIGAQPQSRAADVGQTASPLVVVRAPWHAQDAPDPTRRPADEPEGRLTLTLSANPTVQAELLHHLNVAA